MVLLSAQGMAVAKIAGVTFTSADRVRDVIHNFNADGFDSLYPKYSGGRPRTFALPERREIKKIAKSRPAEHGLPLSTWSLVKLADFLVAEGVVDDISHEGLRVLLREEGVSFQRTKTWKTSRDPNYEAKKARVEHLYAIADGEVIPEVGEPEVISCMDEFGPLNLQPHPGRQWAERGGKRKDPDREPRPRRAGDVHPPARGQAPVHHDGLRGNQHDDQYQHPEQRNAVKGERVGHDDAGDGVEEERGSPADAGQLQPPVEHGTVPPQLVEASCGTRRADLDGDVQEERPGQCQGPEDPKAQCSGDPALPCQQRPRVAADHRYQQRQRHRSDHKQRGRVDAPLPHPGQDDTGGRRDTRQDQRQPLIGPGRPASVKHREGYHDIKRQCRPRVPPRCLR
ncbi:helix-turn-helix domain-containing protein [Streptomyces albulus]|nr:helix-turn-helix domain-containing protein [Streptomyces noursei]GGX55174.1 hypothetical protein GCM10010341_90140 [Streptomyces noursei]